MARKLDESPDPGRDVTLPYESEALAHLVRISTLLSSPAFQRALAGGVVVPDDPNAIPAIYALASWGSLRPGELGVRLHVSAPTASRLVEKLSCAGLVSRLPDPDDSRASLVTLTSEGAEIAAGLFHKGDLMMDTILADWTPADRVALGELLGRLSRGLNSRATLTHR